MRPTLISLLKLFMIKQLALATLIATAPNIQYENYNTYKYSRTLQWTHNSFIKDETHSGQIGQTTIYVNGYYRTSYINNEVTGQAQISGITYEYQTFIEDKSQNVCSISQTIYKIYLLTGTNDYNNYDLIETNNNLSINGLLSTSYYTKGTYQPGQLVDFDTFYNDIRNNQLEPEDSYQVSNVFNSITLQGATTYTGADAYQKYQEDTTTTEGTSVGLNAIYVVRHLQNLYEGIDTTQVQPQLKQQFVNQPQTTYATYTIYIYDDDPAPSGEVIDIGSLFYEILAMPFAFISQAFNLTLFPGTPYELNISNLMVAIISSLLIIIIFRIIMGRKG